MRRLLIGLTATVVLVGGSLAMAQDGGHHHAMTGAALTGGTGPMAGAQPTGNVHTDGEIAAVLATVDRGEITQGTYAQSHGTSSGVRDFGRSMVEMHTAATGRMTALAQRLHVTPAENAESRRLAADGAATQQRLAALSGAAYDRAYVDAQVAAHSQVLALLDSTLIPAARAPELRAALQNDVRPMVASHLQQARDLRGRLP